MTEAERVFANDTYDKKRIARGSFNKRTHCGKSGCTLPSESMSAKEKAALNGPVISYNLSKPMLWAEFRGMPEDLQRRYIMTLQERYNAKDNMLAEMFGVSNNTVFELRTRLVVRANKSRASKEAWAEWKRFCASEPAVEAARAQRKAEYDRRTDELGLTADKIGITAEGFLAKPADSTETRSEKVAEAAEIRSEKVQALPDVTWADLFAAAKLLSERYGVTVKVEVGV